MNIKDVSANTFLVLPEEILKVSNNLEYPNLLSKDMIDAYYYTEMKKDIAKVFTKYNDVKYLFSHRSDCYLSSIHYDTERVSLSKVNNDKVGNYIMNNVDLEIWTKDFYDTIISVSYKLTMQEAVYLVDAFFLNKSEEIISEKLLISRKTLQNIKKSCLVKVYLELQYSNFI